MMPPKVAYWREVTEEVDGANVVRYVPNTNIPSIEEMRHSWCFGLPLANEDGQPMPDSDIKRYVDNAIGEVETRLGIYLKPTNIVCNPEERGISEDEYDAEEHPYDYDANMWRQYGFLQLRERPVNKLVNYKMVLPNGMIVMDFFRDENTRKWVKLDKSGAQIQIVPYAGDPTLFAMMGGTSSGFPFMTGTLNAHLPHMFYVDYVAGFGQHKIPSEVSQVVAKIAAINLLGVAGDAVMVGISSISTSMDGLSESTSLTASAEYATYGAHIAQFRKEVDAFFSPKHGGGRTAYRGFTFTGL